jgi:sugar lactone lactonase YvrE
MKLHSPRFVSILVSACLAIGTVLADEEVPPYFISDNYVGFTVGASNEFTIFAGGIPAPSITCDGTLPSGVTFQDIGGGNATLSGGLPGDGGYYSLTLRASNGVGDDAEAGFTLEVFETTAITSDDHATFTVGELGQFTVTTAGGYPDPTSVALVGDPLPAGLTYTNSGNSGLIQGMPAEGTAGTYNFQFVAHNDGGDTVQDFTLTIGAAPPPLPSVSRPTGLVGWWAADGYAIDLQNDNNGTLNGGAGFAAGRVNRAFQLNGSSGHIAIGNPWALKLRAVTIEAWIKPSAMPANGEMAAIATKWNNNSAKSAVGDAYGLFLINNNGTLQLRAEINPTSGAEMNLQGGSLLLDQWAHVAVAYDNEAGVFTLHVNGIPVAQAEPGHFIVASDVPVMIGRENDNTTPRHFPGLIDEVSIYSRALGTAEISNIYHARENGKEKVSPSVSPPVNLLAWWPADRSVIDLQQDRAAVLPPGAVFAPGMVGQAFDLYGANSGIQIPSDPAWNFGIDQFTIATWVRFAAPDSYQLIAAHEQAGVGLGWRFLFNGFTLQFQFPGGSAGIYPVVPAAQQWYHLAVTRSGSTFRFYVDGLQVGGDQTNATPIPSVDGPLTLGYSPGFPVMNGRIDEFQIVHRALTAQEIAAIYQAGSSGQTKTFFLYVTNPGNGTVTQLDAAGSAIPFASGLSNPLGIALDASGAVHVAENGTNRILKFDATGAGSPLVSSVTDPHGIAFDAQGNLLVASRSQNSIESFDPTGAPRGSLPGGPADLRAPSGLAFDHLDHLHVSNQGNDTIAIFDSVSWSLGSASPLLAGPAGLCFGRGGNLLVANATNHSLVETDATGIGTLFAGAGAGLNQPQDLVSDAAGNLYVTNALADTVLKFDPAGVATLFATLPVGSAPAFIALRQRSPMTPLIKVENLQRSSGGPAVINGQSRPNALVTIRATADLVTPAQTIGETTADSNGTFQFQDGAAVSLPRRFYIAHW